MMTTRMTEATMISYTFTIDTHVRRSFACCEFDRRILSF